MGKNLIRIARSKGRLSLKFYKLSKLIIRAYENYDCNLQTNSGLYILRKLEKFNPRIVFDVGAHYGEWSSAAHAALPGAEIHAFEIVPQTFKRLSEALEGKDRIISNAYGLSDEEGESPVNYFDTKDTHSNIINTLYLKQAPQKNRLMGKLKKGDNYCLENSVDQIDF